MITGVTVPKTKKMKSVVFKKPKAVTLIRARKFPSDETEPDVENVDEIVSDPTFQNWLQYMMDIKKKKDKMRKQGYTNIPTDTRYTGRKRKSRF